MKKLLLFTSCLLLALTSCKDNEKPVDPGPAAPKDPLACFGVSKTFIDSGETVTFTNCSENATGYQWTFSNDSNPSTEKVPAPVTYRKRGERRVTLIVYNQDASKNDDTSIIVTVARHALTKFKLNKVEGVTNDPDGSAPDLKMFYGPSSNPQQYETEIKVDATYPFEWIINPTIILVPANSSNWIFRLMRVDAGGNVTPVTTFSQGGTIFPSRATSSPFKIVSNTNYDIDLYYDLVK